MHLHKSERRCFATEWRLRESVCQPHHRLPCMRRRPFLASFPRFSTLPQQEGANYAIRAIAIFRLAQFAREIESLCSPLCLNPRKTCQIRIPETARPPLNGATTRRATIGDDRRRRPAISRRRRCRSAGCPHHPRDRCRSHRWSPCRGLSPSQRFPNCKRRAAACGPSRGVSGSGHSAYSQ